MIQNILTVPDYPIKLIPIKFIKYYEIIKFKKNKAKSIKQQQNNDILIINNAHKIKKNNKQPIKQSQIKQSPIKQYKSKKTRNILMLTLKNRNNVTKNNKHNYQQKNNCNVVTKNKNISIFKLYKYKLTNKK